MKMRSFRGRSGMRTMLKKHDKTNRVLDVRR